MPRGERWTDFELAEARRLIAARCSPQEFENRMGRSRISAKMRIKYVDSPTFRANAIQRAARDRSQFTEHIKGQPQNRAPEKPKVPHEAIQDALKRAMAPRTITGWFCGDPPPGYSALDRRRA